MVVFSFSAIFVPIALTQSDPTLCHKNIHPWDSRVALSSHIPAVPCLPLQIVMQGRHDHVRDANLQEILFTSSCTKELENVSFQEISFIAFQEILTKSTGISVICMILQCSEKLID